MGQAVILIATWGFTTLCRTTAVARSIGRQHFSFCCGSRPDCVGSNTCRASARSSPARRPPPWVVYAKPQLKHLAPESHRRRSKWAWLIGRPESPARTQLGYSMRS